METKYWLTKFKEVQECSGTPPKGVVSFSSRDNELYKEVRHSLETAVEGSLLAVRHTNLPVPRGSSFSEHRYYLHEGVVRKKIYRTRFFVGRGSSKGWLKMFEELPFEE